MSAPSPVMLDRLFTEAERCRRPWEPLWRQCFAHAAPMRGGGFGDGPDPAADELFDGTACDAVEQLAASLLAELAPPWSRWFELVPGTDLDESARAVLAPELERATRVLESHFARSNLHVELHQCLLDLVTVGTATLLFREAPLGSPSAFRFTAVPVAEMFVLGDGDGRITRQFRRTRPTLGQLRERFPEAELPPEFAARIEEDPERRGELVEAVLPAGDGAFDYAAFVPARSAGLPTAVVLARGRFARSPFLTFRWLKAAGETYGRSPVMTALPDIKTANKVVELVLQNASIAVTGIWLAEDDGVLNPANIDLSPGSIIPKAPGSAGLTPLETPGRFDVSELVLSDLRARIRHTLLVDRLGPVDGPRMTATEVLERSAETARLLGAIYGRLEGELLRPLLDRAVHVLRRRGAVPDLPLDGHTLDVAFRTPLAREQARQDVRNVLLWLETVDRLGEAARPLVEVRTAVRWLAERLGVPAEFVRDGDPLAELAAVAGEGRS